MITLFRWFMVKSKEIKYKLAVWQLADSFLTELSNNPEKIKQTLVDSIVRMVIRDNAKTEGEHTNE